MPNSRTRTSRLLLVSSAEDGTIVGVAPDGTVHASTDGGQGWEHRARLGAAPYELTAAGGGDVRHCGE